MLPPLIIATFTFVLGSRSAWKMNPAVATAPLGSATVSGLAARYLHRLSDLVFRDGDDVVHVSADVFEVDGADALGAETVGEGTGDLFGRELDDLALAQAGLGVGGEFGFDADDFYFGIAELDGSGDAGDKASAADRGEDGFDVRQVFDDFEADGALSGDDVFVVVGRHDGVSVLGGEFFGLDFAFVGAGPDEDDLRAKFRGGVALDLRRVIGHDDHGFRVRARAA